MKSETEESRELELFLLGALSHEQRALIERQFFGDDAFFERICALEDDLVRRFLKNQISLADRALFEDRLQHSPDLRRKTEIARTLMENLDPVGVVVSPARSPVRAGWSMPVWGQWSLAATGVAVVAVMLSVLFVNRGLKSRVLALETELHSRQTATVAAFLLHPGLTRGTAEPVRLRIPAAAQAVLLQLEVTGSPYPRYFAVLRLVGDKAELWSSALQPSDLGSRVLEVLTPGAVLSTGDYVLQLSGTNGSGVSDLLDYYSFSVERR